MQPGKQRLRVLVLMGAVLMAMAASAQTAAQFITWGDRAMAMGEPYGASRYYGEALKAEPGLLDTQWKYAESCRLSHQYAEAAYFYGKVERKDHGRRHPEALRGLAEMQMSTAQYADAARTWAKVRQKERDKSSAVALRADNGLEGCRLATAMKADSLVVVEHLPMPVNGFGSEFAARTGPDSALYFTSLRGEVNADGTVKDTTDYKARIFQVKESGGKWPEPSPLPNSVNNGGNNANAAWSVDGRWFYFAREEAPGEFGIRVVDLHMPADTGAVVLRVPGSTVTQPMAARVGGEQVLFFASNRPGGQGGMDLWRARINGAAVSEVEPLGPVVNTPGNEVTPYFDAADSTLYFSSDYLPGLGGYDLFKCRYGGSNWGKPQNLGQPFNGPANELYPDVDAASGTGWFTSNREGSFTEKGSTCCNDLYRFRYPRQAKEPPPIIAVDTVKTIAAAKRITSLREKLPIRLYFHNDEPDPRSWDSTTTLDYAGTFRSYQALKPAYDSAWSSTAGGSAAFDAFFAGQVEAGYAQLNSFMALLAEALGEGQQITLVIRGYASPLAKSDYNRNLSMRRIASLANYLHRADGAMLLPYLDGTAANGGRLTLVRKPYGKSTAAAHVSDRLDDLRHSVYSVGAAQERRIEIEQVMGTP